MTGSQFSTLVGHLAFPDHPRWHEGRLYVSDVHAHRVLAIDRSGVTEEICSVAGRPAGIGWLSTGEMLVVSMTDRRLMRLGPDGPETVADLSGLAAFHTNALAVSSDDHAYVGNFGFDVDGGAEPVGTSLTCVEPDGEAWIVVEALLFPNAMAVDEDDRTLIVAESFGQRLSAYDINPDGSLHSPRVWADLRPNVPHGMCLDAQGGAWVSDPVHMGLMRIHPPTGSVDWISTGERRPYGLTLGGEDGYSLFVCTAESSNPARTTALASGRVEVIRVDVPAVGFA